MSSEQKLLFSSQNLSPEASLPLEARLVGQSHLGMNQFISLPLLAAEKEWNLEWELVGSTVKVVQRVGQAGHLVGVPSREQLGRNLSGEDQGDHLGGNTKTSTPQAACWWRPCRGTVRGELGRLPAAQDHLGITKCPAEDQERTEAVRGKGMAKRSFWPWWFDSDWHLGCGWLSVCQCV